MLYVIRIDVEFHLCFLQILKKPCALARRETRNSAETTDFRPPNAVETFGRA